MSDILLAILAVVLVLLVVAVAISAASGLTIVVGKFLERAFDLLVPHRRTGVGPEDLVDEIGTVIQIFASEHESVPPRGMIRLRGEQWSAQAAPGMALSVGHPVRVVSVDGVVLVVEPAEAQ